MRLRIDEIEATSATQVRVKLNPDIIDQYTEDYKNGADMPPVDIYNEGGGSKRNILADGFHRIIARKNAGFDDINVELHEGGMHEALMHALGANGRHGLRRTNADKRHAVEMALKDPEISQFKRQEIANICGVTKRTVQTIANQKAVGDEDEDNDDTPEKPEPNKPANNRPSKPEPTQEDIELAELRQALSLIRAFPYDGSEAGKLALEDYDIANLEYVSTWCAQAVLAGFEKDVAETGI